MYKVKENGVVINLSTGKVFKTEKGILKTSSGFGTVFDINLKYESRLTGCSVPELKKIYDEKSNTDRNS